MKSIIIGVLVFCAANLSAQVGIGTSVPDNSAMLDVTASDKGVLFPRLSSTQRAAIVAPATGLHVFDTNSNSLWYFNGSVWINTAAEASLGDVKSGFQPNDHSGWLKLDGRSVNTLNANQQAAAITLGFTTNLPDASSAYLAQNTGTLGAITGANTTTLTQANLPNVSFTGTAASAGTHSHTVDPESVNTSGVGDHNHTTNSVEVNTTTNGNHTHGHNATGGPLGYGLVYANGHATLGSSDYTWGEPNGYVTPGALDIHWNGNHSHSVTIPATTSNAAGGHNHSVNIPATTSTTDGAHTHTVSVASGGSATPINIAPKSLNVNMFIYLGL
jgi:hypothetical protein